MLKKLLSSILALSFIFTLSLSSFASGSSPSAKEIVEKGKLVKSEIVSTDKGSYKKEVYSYTKALPLTRSSEQEFEQSTCVMLAPMTSRADDGFTADATEHALTLRIRYAVRSYADDYSDMLGYRLTRVVVENNGSNTQTDHLTAMNHSGKFGAETREYDLSDEIAPFIITKYPNCSNYVANIITAAVGARVSYYWDVLGIYDTVDVFVFNNGY